MTHEEMHKVFDDAYNNPDNEFMGHTAGLCAVVDAAKAEALSDFKAGLQRLAATLMDADILDLLDALEALSLGRFDAIGATS